MEKRIRTKIVDCILPHFQNGNMTQEEFIYHLEGLMSRFDEFCENDEYDEECE